MSLEHGRQVLDGRQVISELGRTHLADDGGGIAGLVAVHLVLGSAGRSLENPGVVLRTRTCHLLPPRTRVGPVTVHDLSSPPGPNRLRPRAPAGGARRSSQGAEPVSLNSCNSPVSR